MDKRGVFFVLAASLLWGTTGTSQALAPREAQPLAIGALRLLVGGTALCALLLWQQRINLEARSQRQPARSRLPLGSVMLGGLCMAAYQVLFFAGLRMTGVAVGTIVGIGSSPVLAGLLGFLFRGERPGWRWGIATLLAIAGCSLLALSGNDIQVNPLGMLLAMGAGAAYATFSLLSKRMLESQPVEKVMALSFGLGALMLAPLLLTQDIRWLASLRGAGVILHLGLVTTALAYVLFGLGLKRIPLATAVTLSLAEPLTAGTLGVLLLGERLSLPAAVGIALIFSGLVLLSVNFKRPALA